MTHPIVSFYNEWAQNSGRSALSLMLWDLGCVLGRKFPNLTWENETHLRMHAQVHFNQASKNISTDAINVIESINVAPPGGRSFHYMTQTTQVSCYVEHIFHSLGFNIDNAYDQRLNPTTVTPRAHPKSTAHGALKAQGMWVDFINTLPDID